MTSNNLEAIELLKEVSKHIRENPTTVTKIAIDGAIDLLQADEVDPLADKIGKETYKPTKETKLERLERLKRGMFLGSQISSEEVLSEIVDILLEEEY